LLVWRESIAALLKSEATCVSRSDGMAIPLLFAVKKKKKKKRKRKKKEYII
jgi:hypothetical protein